MERPPGLWYDAVRYFLAVSFLVYGGAKVADIQFNPAYQPAMIRTLPANDLTGFELVWRFFGHSRVYHSLIGLAEISAAGLLLFVRTAPLGAAVFLPIIGNVVAVDLLYGVSTDATFVALARLAGDLLLLWVDCGRFRRAVGDLLRPRTEGATLVRVLLGWAFAVVLVVVVFGAAMLVKVIRGE